MNNEVQKIIDSQLCPDTNTIDTLLALANTKFNKKQRMEFGGILSTIVDCYQYGVMVGKRQERARHKKHSDR